MKLSIAALSIFLFAAGTPVHAQAPKARDAEKACNTKSGADEIACIKQVCAKAAKPANCESNATKDIRASRRRAAAEAACKGKTGKDHTHCLAEHMRK